VEEEELTSENESGKQSKEEEGWHARKRRGPIRDGGEETVKKINNEEG